MKRKRGKRTGHKKGAKKLVVKDLTKSPVSLNTEESSQLGQSDRDQHNSEAVPESATLLEKLSTVSTTGVDASNDGSTGKPGNGRFKVKLKSSRVLEPHRSSSDAQTHSDTDRSNLQVPVETNDAAVEKDTAYSDGQTSLPRKTGSIKIKTSRVLVSSTEKKADVSVPTNKLQREKDPRYNEKELSEALAVIKKVMKMDAAGPFNAPVNPVALGIPDYFDIIDTPMDFGTICNDLENGRKYMNSEDVYKDVQFIWENCYKYNNKGDYIVDLMKRVKKNFMKYWSAAGLYSEVPDNSAAENSEVQEISRSGQEKVHQKGKSKRKRRRYGIDLHKGDCLCAVCVVRRRRKEREENSAVVENEMAITVGNLSQQFKLEESSPADNPGSDDGTSSSDHSPEPNANGETEDAENEEKMENFEQIHVSRTDQPEVTENQMEVDHLEICVNNQPSELPRDEDGTDDSNQPSDDEDEYKDQNELENITSTQQKEDLVSDHPHEEAAERAEQVKTEENIAQQENHMVLKLCASLFPSNPNSLWRGPHSLARRPVAVRESPIHAAVATLMKQ
ncbi:bromodomain testis-specific protein [Ananas comosus]|uniref:Bromodomain testis-specific protein n=1 Tax=Ananas comosus TaxID=4615 RepID=A0A6P5EYG1_ANACO|nr:bromodomain testis-specific protein [Ananas comosus]